MKKKTLKEFITKFQEKFPNKNFDFSESVYNGSHNKMKVKCCNGHDFFIRPCDLLNGYGCSVCFGNKKLTEEDFIKEANYVHNNYFSYEKCTFTNVISKVAVTCPIHGVFFVKANNHLNGANCKLCQKEGITHKITKRETANRTTRKITLEDFKKKLKEKLGNDYVIEETCQKFSYRNKLNVFCKFHGWFSITPSHLLSGRGCPICAKNKKKNLEEIILEIKTAHPYSDFDYSKVVYKGIHMPIILKCNKCGAEFSNSPSNLITYKNGCPCCGVSQLENEIKSFLEDNNIVFVQQKTFPWLKSKRNLKLDFFLPQYNVAIECQGIQHFKDIPFSKENICFAKDNLVRDKLKKVLCENNGVKVFYYANYHFDFPYKVYEEKEKLLFDIKHGEND